MTVYVSFWSLISYIELRLLNNFNRERSLTMKTLLCKHTMRLFISLTLFFAVGVPSSIAQQKIKVAGKMTAASTKQKVIAVGNV